MVRYGTIIRKRGLLLLGGPYPQRAPLVREEPLSRLCISAPCPAEGIALVSNGLCRSWAERVEIPDGHLQARI